MNVVLETKNVRVEYGSFVALPDFSIRLGGGQILGLIGPNGAGKTTSLRAASGQLPLAAGWVEVLGARLAPGKLETLVRIGFAADTPPLYDELTVEDFLRFIGKAYRIRGDQIEERIDFWLDQLWLTDRRSSKIKSLSRGMKQRLTVARTLLPDPAVVLLDEPASGLDPAGRVQFRRMLRSLADQGKALIVSSHILADLHEFCSHIGIMEAGRLKQFGTVAQVVGGQADNRCAYRVTLSLPTPDARRVLSAMEGVSGLDVQGREISFEYEHDASAAAKLLSHCVRAGLPIAQFTPLEQDLEQAYLRSGIKQVD